MGYAENTDVDICADGWCVFNLFFTFHGEFSISTEMESWRDASVKWMKFFQNQLSESLPSDMISVKQWPLWGWVPNGKNTNSSYERAAWNTETCIMRLNLLCFITIQIKIQKVVYKQSDCSFVLLGHDREKNKNWKNKWIHDYLKTMTN